MREVGCPGHLEICGLLRILNEPLPFVRREKYSNVNISRTLQMVLAKEVTRNAEVSKSDILFVVGVYHGNIPELQGETGGTACNH